MSPVLRKGDFERERIGGSAKVSLGEAQCIFANKQWIRLLERLLQHLGKQQEHVDSASLVTGSESVPDLQQSRVIEGASLNSFVWFWWMESALTGLKDRCLCFASVTPWPLGLDCGLGGFTELQGTIGMVSVWRPKGEDCNFESSFLEKLLCAAVRFNRNW